MSKRESSKRANRRAKQSRFKAQAKSPAKAQTNRTPLIIGGVVAVLAVVLIVGGILRATNQGAGQASSTSVERAPPERPSVSGPMMFPVPKGRGRTGPHPRIAEIHSQRNAG